MNTQQLNQQCPINVYNQMTRLHRQMESYKRKNKGTPSLVLQEKLNALLAPYAN